MTKESWRIIEVTPENLGQYSLGCIKSKKHEGYVGKKPWFEKMTELGMLTLLLVDAENKPQGFLEMIPGKNTWRGVEAEEYMVIHCIWIASKKMQGIGAGAFMLEEAMKRVPAELAGAAVVTSDTSFIASSSLFEKHGFEKVDEKHQYQLYRRNTNVKKIKAPLKFNENKYEGYTGLHMIYTMQCPMAIKWKNDIMAFCEDNGIPIVFDLLESPAEAQANPNPLGTFALVYDDRLIEDHPVSLGRFKNIVKKELKLLP